MNGSFALNPSPRVATRSSSAQSHGIDGTKERKDFFFFFFLLGGGGGGGVVDVVVLLVGRLVGCSFWGSGIFQQLVLTSHVLSELSATRSENMWNAPPPPPPTPPPPTYFRHPGLFTAGWNSAVRQKTNRGVGGGSESECLLFIFNAPSLGGVLENAPLSLASSRAFYSKL